MVAMRISLGQKRPIVYPSRTIKTVRFRSFE
ncbi:Uncharacterised protein [Vibrio cholerae]|nr:Uncharacterised protein [Vibrio cholerae]